MKLFVSVPTHSETMAAETVHTIVAAQSIACRRGWRFYFHHFAAAVIGEVRNVIAATFLESGADVLLMIDADQAASAATIEGMLDFGKPFVGCICARRQFYWSQADLAKASSVEALRYQALRFVGYLEEDEHGRAEIVNGFGKATFVGAGLLVLHRSVFERMMEHYPELEGKGFDLSFHPSLSTNWGFFNPIDRGDGMFLSEDLSFSRRWREMGGEIWADVASDVSHIGRNDYRGNYLDYLKAHQPG